MNGEFRAALGRGLFHAVLVSFMSFLVAWVDPDISYRSLITISLTPGLTVLGARFIGEGWYDTKQAAKLAATDQGRP